MQKLRIILQSKSFYVILFVICFIYSFIFIYNHKHKQIDIDLNRNSFEGIITDYNIKDNKVTMTLKSDQLYKVTYYSNNIDINNICFGCRVRINGSLELPNKNTVFHAFNYREYLANNNIYYVIKAKSIYKISECNNVVCNIENYFNKRISEIDNTGYMSSFILGDKSNLDDYELYQNLGVAHLFAISGMHIGLFIGLLLLIFKKFNDFIKYPIIFIILLIYGAVLGFSASVLRCIIFFIISSLNKILKLNINSIQTLLLTSLIILFGNPLMIYNVGFQFSALTVFGIIYCNDYIYGNYITKAIKMSFIAFLFSFPISLLHFYSINLISIMYNLIYIPYVTFIVYPLCLISFIMPAFYKLFIFLVKMMVVVSIILNKLNCFKLNMSLNVLEVLLIYLILFFIFRFNRKKLLLLIVLILFIDYIIPYFDSNSYIYFFDVGQGDSMLIISAYRKDVVLLDTGGRSNYEVSDNVINLLNYLGINKIDLMILSHGDEDHAGEVQNYINNKRINHLKINEGELSQFEELALKYINNDNYEPKGLKISYLDTKLFDNENDNSLITYFDIDGYRFLSMGDASYVTEKELMNKYYIGKIDILKVGHHGSKTSSSKYFINSINPTYSVISVGKYNKYGHPSKEALNILSNSKIYRTDQDGSVLVKIKSKSIIIDTCLS